MNAFDVVSLSAMAREIGWDAERLKRHLVKLNEELHGLVLRQEPPKPGSRKGGTCWVNRAALAMIREQDARTLTARVEGLEAFRVSATVRLEELEARVA